MHGKGMMEFPDGAVYEGTFVHNRKNGLLFCQCKCTNDKIVFCNACAFIDISEDVRKV